jgi:hypothetical protein
MVGGLGKLDGCQYFLIAVGTSVELQLSTTYVTFTHGFAMGSSFADRAWDKRCLPRFRILK